MRAAVPLVSAVLVFAVLVGLTAGCTDQTVERPRPSPSTPLESSDGEGAGPSPEPVEDDPFDAGTSVPKPDASPPKDAGAAPTCTSKFGSGITPSFGRLDGVVRAVVVPGDFSCPGDDDHVIVQVDAGGATYAVWINVESNRASSPLVATREKAAALEGPAWSSGWHTAVSLDYPYGLDVHASSFVAKTKADLGAAIATRVKVGAKVSVFADGFATGDGAHEVHRNANGVDGALVVDPTTSPTYLLFAFADQTF